MAPDRILQQLLLQLGATSRLETFTGRADGAAVGAALAFGVVHAPLSMPQARGDMAVVLANALVLQAPIAVVFCVGFLRHERPSFSGSPTPW